MEDAYEPRSTSARWWNVKARPAPAAASLRCIRQPYNWTTYDTNNSPLPHNIIYEVVIDKQNRKWIATQGGGIAVFDDTSWVVYDTSNSGILHNTIYAIAIDSSDNKWIGTWGSGAVKFDGTNWINYSTHNTIIPNVKVCEIFIDNKGVKWIGSAAGLLSFNDTLWTLYDETNSPLGRWAVYSITQIKIKTCGLDLNSMV